MRYLQKPGVKNREVFSTVGSCLAVGRAFKRNGLSAALDRLPAEHKFPSRSNHDLVTVFCARSAATRLLGLTRTLSGQHWCLHEALVVCNGLRKLGFSVQIAIGYPLLEVADAEHVGKINHESTQLHAWPGTE